MLIGSGPGEQVQRLLVPETGVHRVPLMMSAVSKQLRPESHRPVHKYERAKGEVIRQSTMLLNYRLATAKSGLS